jgi:hypothetical protein
LTTGPVATVLRAADCATGATAPILPEHGIRGGGGLERFFGLAAHGTTPGRDVLAGLTTFLAMVYIVAVNPAMMADAGIDHGAAFTATCLAAAIGSALVGLVARLPVALAPGMGLNASSPMWWWAAWACHGRWRSAPSSCPASASWRCR